MKQLIILLSFLLPLIVQSQKGGWDWAKNNNNGIYNCVATYGDDIFLLKTRNSFTGEFDTIWIEKYNSNGLFKWKKTIAYGRNANPLRMIVDDKGNFIITGIWGCWTSVKPYDSLYVKNTTIPNHGYTDIFLIKADSFGNILWATAFGGNDHDMHSYPPILYLDSDNNIFTTINCTLSDSFYIDATSYYKFYGIVKFNKNGKFVGSFCNWGFENVIIKDNIYSTSNDHVYKIKTSLISDGNFGISCGNANPIMLLPSFDNKMLFAGTYYQSVILGGKPLPLYGSNDIFIGKYDTNGNLIWYNTWGSSTADRIICGGIDKSGNILICCDGLDTVYFSDGNSLILTGNQYLVFMDVNGKIMFKQSIAGAAIKDISTDVSGNFYICAAYEDSIILSSNLKFIGNTGGVFAKYNPLSNSVSPNQNKSFNINIFPNPVISKTFFIENINVRDDEILYKVIDVSGKVVQHGVINTLGSISKIDLSGNLSGIYFLQLTLISSNISVIKKILVE